ncbi:MAG: UDP-N-acetylglucosamine 2-epimerase (non-hydrolyzing) [candidate division Zixibacteria bacterium]|nr:UDP-N-acetylglucosamine 2-epimerase (non-hydrolyzing) [candidate division Zixibacteria bacterium]
MPIFGTRPEAVKMAPVVEALKRRPETFDIKICVTAQHRELLDQVLSLFRIEPDFDMGIMQANQSLSYTTSTILTRLEDILKEHRPDWVLVHGDTTTSMTAALAGFYQRIRVGHVEAGLRTGDRYAPYPEEINRRIADTLSDLHFAPTQGARDNLLREGYSPDTIHVTGNTVIDALLSIIHQGEGQTAGLLNSLVMPGRRLIVVTAHRRENLGAPLEQICHALIGLAHHYKKTVQIIYPVHPNPRVRETVHRLLGQVENITLTDPLEYLPFVHLLNRATLILTDSGGIQEEAPSLGVPVLVLRDVTERPEGVEAGTLKLVGSDTQGIMDETIRLFDDPVEYRRMSQAQNPYGDGRASERIAHVLAKWSLS